MNGSLIRRLTWLENVHGNTPRVRALLEKDKYLSHEELEKKVIEQIERRLIQQYGTVDERRKLVYHRAYAITQSESEWIDYMEKDADKSWINRLEIEIRKKLVSAGRIYIPKTNTRRY